MTRPPIRAAAFAATLLSVLTLAPGAAFACACGCDVFDVGGTDTAPPGMGGTVSLEYDFMDQTRNWSATAAAPAAGNPDKQIRTHFVTAGVQYMVNHDWGFMAEVPVWSRSFRTENDAGDGVDRFDHAALGDIRLMGVYTGLSPGMSTGLLFGVKLPTGDWKYAGFDRDTEIGTGSTNLLLGGYHFGSLGAGGAWGYFARGLLDAPLASQGGYRPGAEFDAAVGVSYRAASLAGGKLRITPVLQLIASTRGRDAGPAAAPANSGYDRILVAPGVGLDGGAWRLYGDVEIPVYQDVRGQQLTARVLFKLAVSRRF
jgi:hypothetical protein